MEKVTLSEYLINKGITQTQISNELGCTRSFINAIVMGKRPLTDNLLNYFKSIDNEFLNKVELENKVSYTTTNRESNPIAPNYKSVPFKKRIIKLLESEDGILKINKYTRLVRYTKSFGRDVDILKLELSITRESDYIVNLSSREFEGIKREVTENIKLAFEKAGEEFAKEFENGHLS